MKTESSARKSMDFDESRRDAWRRRGVGSAAVAAALLLATGCQTTQGGLGQWTRDTFASSDPCSNNARNIGIVAGAVGGAVLGKAVGNSKTAMVVGAGVGTALGGLIGYNVDQRRCDLHRLAQKHQMDMAVEEIQLTTQENGKAATRLGGLSVSVRDGAQFASGSARLSASGTQAFTDVARAYRQKSSEQEKPQEQQARLQNMRILLVGHTDDTGSSAGNADLSQARAKAVADIFAAQGFDKGQIFYQGAGETLPIADNASEEGRARNRRVEIVDLSDDEVFAAYLAGRRANIAFYREGAAVAGSQMAAAPAMQQSKPSAKPTAQAAAKTAPKPTARPAATPSATAAASAPAPGTSVAPARSGSLDFGGSPVNGRATVVQVGQPQAARSTFSLLPVAQASETSPPLGSCLNDRPRISHGVMSLKTGTLRTTDYLPGVYDSSWFATVNGHLVALNHVAVLRDGALPARKPDLLIYRDYQNNASVPPTWKSSPEVNAYSGEKGILYRVFADGPVRCMDILIPHQNPVQADGSNLIYPGQGDYYQVGFSPRLAKSRQ